jgi:hypothetical protein
VQRVSDHALHLLLLLLLLLHELLSLGSWLLRPRCRCCCGGSGRWAVACRRRDAPVHCWWLAAALPLIDAPLLSLCARALHVVSLAQRRNSDNSSSSGGTEPTWRLRSRQSSFWCCWWWVGPAVESSWKLMLSCRPSMMCGWWGGGCRSTHVTAAAAAAAVATQQVLLLLLLRLCEWGGASRKHPTGLLDRRKLTVHLKIEL